MKWSDVINELCKQFWAAHEHCHNYNGVDFGNRLEQTQLKLASTPGAKIKEALENIKSQTKTNQSNSKQIKSKQSSASKPRK